MEVRIVLAQEDIDTAEQTLIDAGEQESALLTLLAKVVRATA
jgi:hypothetical protein